MFLEDVKVLENRYVGDKYYLMKVRAPKAAKAAKAGQFFMIKCNDSVRVLRRPISLHNADAADMTLEFYYEQVGKGTAEFAHLQAGDEINIQGPLGTGFDTDVEGKKVILVGGGMGMAPLKLLAEKLSEKNDVNFIAGGRDKGAVEIVKNFHVENIIIATDDGSVGRKGNTVEVLKDMLSEGKYDVVYTCGPHGMMLAVADTAHKAGVRCQISLEERMACGVKACVGCSIKTKAGMKKVCADGPVFDAESILDLDPADKPSCECKGKC